MNNIRRLDKIDIPSYTFSQELFNSVSHLFGIPLGLISITIGTILYFLHGLQLIYYIGLLVFGVTTILLYLMSSLYHIETPVKESSKKIKRIVDHCTIYLLIAGTYTPICLYLNSINPI